MHRQLRALCGLVAAALGMTLLVACVSINVGQAGPGGGTGQPTPTGVPVAPSATPVPVTPTAAHATATPPPVGYTPDISVAPTSGGPGTLVTVSGQRFSPGARIAIRLGLPNPMGEVLASVVPGDDTTWQTTLVIPEALPSGDPIPDGPFFLHAMDEQNRPLVAVEFDFIPPAAGPSREDAAQTVRDMLAAYAGGGDVRPFLSGALLAELEAGRPLDQALGLHPVALQSFTVHPPEDRPSEVLFVPATLSYAGFGEDRSFTLVGEGGGWRVSGSSLVTIPAADASDVVARFLAAAQADSSLQTGLFYLGGELRDQVRVGNVDVGAALLIQNPFSRYELRGVTSSSDDMLFVEAQLFFGEGDAAGAARLFTVSDREDGLWRIFKISDPALIPPPPAA